MAPFALAHLFGERNLPYISTITTRASESQDQLRAQWQSPTDIFSILLILGPDVIQKALAQLAGGRFVPMAFSFGWVAYSINALLAVVGDGRLMPDADVQPLVIGAKGGHQRSNKSWIIGRLFRDFLSRSAPFTAIKSSPDWEALRISVYAINDQEEQGVPSRDWIWYSGFVTIAVQVSIAIVPLALNSEWATLILVVAGNLLAWVHAALPQWRSEKWDCRRGGSTVALTNGNGSRNAMLILGHPNAIDLEILATGTNFRVKSRGTKAMMATLAVLWTILLISVAGLKQGSWYLLGIGAIGMVQNIVVAGSQRPSSTCGIHIAHIRTISASKVSKALMIAEESYEGVGLSLIPVYYPGGFRVPNDDIDFWRKKGITNAGDKVDDSERQW